MCEIIKEDMYVAVASIDFFATELLSCSQKFSEAYALTQSRTQV